MRNIYFLLTALILIGACNQAKPPEEIAPQIVSITASIQPESCAVGEAITLTVHLEFSGKNKISEPRAKGVLDGFAVVSRSISTQMNYVNGKKSQSQDIILMLVAQKAGSWKIPSYEVKADGGKIYSTDEIQITVTETPQGKDKRLPQERRIPREKKEMNDNEAITI